MPSSLKFSENNKVKLPYEMDANYPELLAILVASILIAYHCQFSPNILIFLAIITLISFTTAYYTYKFGAGTKQTIIIVLLMSFIFGFMQFNLHITLSFILLIAIRLIISEPELRLRLVLYCIAGALSAAFVGGQFYNTQTTHIEYIETIVVLSAGVITVWQFYLSQTSQNNANMVIEEAQTRISTMVAVINKLTRYLPSQVYQPVIRYDAPVKVFNKRTKLTVMFSDIAGFTELSEKLSADDVADILNTYMGRMTDIAQRYDAVLDKFIGDGMLCFFGAPDSKGIREDALACTAMAIDMRREMRTLRHQWRLQGFDGLYIRIGITTGYCHVGNFGSDSRMSYTLIGREANLASRLESAASHSDILISQSTYDYVCHEFECVFKGRLRLKGLAEPIKTYAVLDPDATQRIDSRWVDYDLPGFNLHLNFEDIKNYDYKLIKSHLHQALEKVSKIEDSSSNSH